MSDTPTTIGRYQVKRWLASGAMGEVYEAYDPMIDRPIAIKMLHREFVDRDDAADRLERFRREARAAGRHIHPNIVTVLDFGEQDGIPFIAMEYVPGDNVDTALKEIGQFEPARAVSITRQVLSALEFAHANGIIHRDIKPSNILLPKSGPIKVADFGIAHLESSDLTIDGDLLGTPLYMAPEQLSGGAVDHRADIFATGLLLYEMLTGEKAFKGRNVFDLVRTMQSSNRLNIWAKHPAVPAALAAMANRALAFDPDRRYATAAAFSRSLRVFYNWSDDPIGEHHADATVVLAPAAPVTQVTPTNEPISEERSPAPTDQSPPQTGTIGAEILAAITLDLATFIGPLARINVRRASANCSDIGLLYRELANLIDRETDRAAFLAKSQQRSHEAQRTPSLSLSKADERLAQTGLIPGALPSDVLSRIEAGLVEHVGPIGRILVKRYMSQTNSVIDLCRELAAFIPDERARAKFLHDQRAG